MITTDPYNLQRFLGAQEGFYSQALKEIRNGYKASHWMWFIFPQLRGLGHSPMADNYGISSLDEARAYLNDPVLKSHLVEISTELLRHSKGGLFRKPKTAEQIFGYTDALKVRSCMTLFDLVEPNTIFAQVLDAFYNGERDALTMQILDQIDKNYIANHIFPCLGAIIGDTVGSAYTFDNVKSPDFQPLFAEEADFARGSILTIAVADWIANTGRSIYDLENRFDYWARFKYPNATNGLGFNFRYWLYSSSHPYGFTRDKECGRHPYYSFGNIAAARASACGWGAYSLQEALDLGKRSAMLTHDHPEGIKGAQAVAVAIHLALKMEPKDKIRRCLEDLFDYDLQHSCDEIRAKCNPDRSCQGTLPPALIAFFDSHDFESAIRLAVSLGGDSDTLACITGSIAQAYYKEIPESIILEMIRRLPSQFWTVMEQLETTIVH